MLVTQHSIKDAGEINSYNRKGEDVLNILSFFKKDKYYKSTGILCNHIQLPAENKECDD